MSTKNTDPNKMPWLIKRLKISAGFYFTPNGQAQSAIRRSFLTWRHVIGGRDPETFEEARAAFGIRNDDSWDSFLALWTKRNGVIRRANNNGGASWVQAQTQSATQHIIVTMDAGNNPGGPAGSPPPASSGSQTRIAYRRMVQELRRDMEAAQRIAKEAIENEQKLLREQETKITEALAEVKDAAPVTLVIEHQGPKPSTETLGMVHRTLPDLILRLKAGLNIYLVGPAGGGKTKGAEMAAHALKLDFGFMSVGPQTTKTDILGYMSATGKYVETEFRRRYEDGGVFLFDEIDAGNGGVLTCINAALAGSAAAFPDKMVKRHATFLCVAAANTFGTGPDRIYVGRQELDGATLDRYNFLEWGYDEALEMAIVKNINATIAARWVPYIQAARKAVEALSIRHVVSPRASIFGTQLLVAGDTWEKAERTQLWKSLKPAEVERIRAKMTADGFRPLTMTAKELAAAVEGGAS